MINFYCYCGTIIINIRNLYINICYIKCDISISGDYRS